MAEAVGFEPTCPCGQLHFECSSLQPLRYASMYKYSLLGTNHMISSQSRYDHFDTLPCMFTLQNEGNNRYSFFQKTRATTIPARLVTACFAALSVTIILYHIRRGFARLFPQNLARIFPPRRTRVWFRGGLSAVF